MSEGLDDKIINHLCSKYLLFPVLERKMISASVATRKGMGTKAGILYIKKHLKEKKENFYVLKCDVHKFFYSIDQDVLMQKLRQSTKMNLLFKSWKKLLVVLTTLTLMKKLI